MRTSILAVLGHSVPDACACRLLAELCVTASSPSAGHHDGIHVCPACGVVVNAAMSPPAAAAAAASASPAAAAAFAAAASAAAASAVGVNGHGA